MADDSSERFVLLNRLADEFAARYRQGDLPSLEEYIDRYPDLADDIREFFPALVEMEQVKEDRDQVRDRPAAGPLPPLERLGDFRILREIGRGGMGVVYEAEQVSLGRHVALKVLPSHALLDPRHVRRFQREAKSAARLHHTNIVPVYGVGEHERLNYYVMQFIPGLGLDEVLDELKRLRAAGSGDPRRSASSVGRPESLSAVKVAEGMHSGTFSKPASARRAASILREPAPPTQAGSAAGPGLPASESSIHLPGQTEETSLAESGRAYWQSVARVGAQVAAALDHALQLGVLHRDIKPSNLLLDEQGNVWVTDFGLAKAQADGDDLTQSGDLVGTLRYMAPERFSGQGDVRSDVYSLGLTLYELLTLRPAYAETDRNQLVKRVMHDEPVRPRKLNPAVPRDLETVVLKAMARDPTHRYQTPAELGEDLKRYLEDRPIRARRVSELERFWRWCRRNPELAGLAACLVLSLVVGVVGTSLKWREAESQRRVAVGEKQEAQHARQEAETARNEAFQQRRASQRQTAELLFDRGVALAEQGEAALGLHWMLESLRAAPADADDLRRVVRINLAAWGEQVHALRRVYPSPEGWVRGLAFSPDAKNIVAATNSQVQVWDTNTGESKGKPIPGGGTFITAFALSPNGKSVLLGKRDGEVQLWDLATRTLIDRPLLHRREVRGVAFSTDGETILTGSEDGTACLWDTATRRPLDTPFRHPMPVLSVAFCPNGKLFLSGVGAGHNDQAGEDSGPGAAHLWDIATGKLLGPPVPLAGGVHAVAFSPDGQVILTGSADGTARQWDRRTGKPKGAALPHRHRVEQVSFTPDGAAVVTGSERAFRAFLWDAKTGQRLGTPLWHQEALQAVALGPDGKTVLTGGADGTFRLWQVGRSLSRPADPNASFQREVSPGPRREEKLVSYLLGQVLAYSTDRRTVVVSNGGRIARLWDTQTGQPKGAPLRHDRLVRAVALSPEGTRVATSSHAMQAGPGTVHLWDAATGRPLAPPIPQPDWVAALAFSPDGRVLAMGRYWTGLIQLWDVNTGKPLGTPLETKGIVYHLTFSPDGKTLAVGSVARLNEAQLWDVAACRRIGHAMPHRNWVWQVVFSPDGKLLLTLSNDRTVRLWNAATGEPQSDYLPHQGLTVAAFSPDGKTLATGGGDGRARLWDVKTGQPVHGATLLHGSQVTALAFSPDGQILGTGAMDGSGRLWDVATFKPLGPPLVQRGELSGVAFTPDGCSFLTSARDGTTRLWPVPRPLEGDRERITLELEVRTGMQMDAGQAVVYLDPATWEGRRRQLIAVEGTADRAWRSSVSDADYHEARARDAEQAGATFTALWHLDHLIAVRPHDWLLYARRGRVYSTAGQLDKADTEYQQASKYTPSGALIDWYHHRVVDCDAAGQDTAARWYRERVTAGLLRQGNVRGASEHGPGGYMTVGDCATPKGGPLFSPRPCTRGRGDGGEGANTAPEETLTPTPLP